MGSVRVSTYRPIINANTCFHLRYVAPISEPEHLKRLKPKIEDKFRIFHPVKIKEAVDKIMTELYGFNNSDQNRNMLWTAARLLEDKRSDVKKHSGKI